MGPKVAIIPLRLALAAVALLVIGATYAWVRADQTTRITVYNPTGFTATEEVSGSCFTGSIAAQRAGAFRCIAGNSIYDPAFAINGAVAFPVGDPAENKGVLINLTEPLPGPPDAWTNPPDVNNPQPWRVDLVGGGVCGMLTGTRPAVEFPLGCSIPDIEEPAYCMIPVPLAARPTAYVTVCGVFDEATREIVQQRAYLAARMWL